jgi:hypothetical protein
MMTGCVSGINSGRISEFIAPSGGALPAALMQAGRAISSGSATATAAASMSVDDVELDDRPGKLRGALILAPWPLSAQLREDPVLFRSETASQAGLPSNPGTKFDSGRVLKCCRSGSSPMAMKVSPSKSPVLILAAMLSAPRTEK